MSAGTAVADMRAEVQEHWWIPLVQGISALLLGILLLTYTAPTTAVIVGFIGFYWLISGVVNVVAIFVDRAMWGWKLFVGVLGILAGLLIIMNIFEHPLITTWFTAAVYVWVLGLQGLMIGIVEIIQAFQGAGWGRGILGFLSALIGLWLLANPVLAAPVLPLVFGILLLVMGGFAIYMAFKIKNA
jgi:uncharacterized membrane protein HdeD (DUF308 family)